HLVARRRGSRGARGVHSHEPRRPAGAARLSGEPMKSLERRRFLQSAVAGFSAGTVLVSCAKKPLKREDVLSRIVSDVVCADIAAVVTESRALDSAIDRFLAAPAREGLAGARDAWKRALLAWKRAYCFRSGPLIETNALLRATFWPIRPAAVDAAL